MKTLKFGKLADGREAGLYILESPDGMRAAVTDYGAALVSLAVPDAKGVMRDVVLGHDDAAGYESGSGHIGATVGRFANRIAGAGFDLNGEHYDLTANNGPNCLHGGKDFFRNRLWSVKVPFTTVQSGDIMAAYAAESIADKDPAPGLKRLNDNKLTFYIDSPDGDQGFPGNMHLEVTYSLPGNGELRIEYKATSDADTPLNLTNHSYFNLDGHDAGYVGRHALKLYSESFTPSDENQIPTGEVRAVEDTPFDFRTAKRIGRDIDADDDQLKVAGGYDHNFIITGGSDETATRSYNKAASLYSEESGILMDVFTDMPCVQLYTANGMDAEPGKDDVYYERRGSVCLETQMRPDAINSDDSSVRDACILKAGETFESVTSYIFSAPEAK